MSFDANTPYEYPSPNQSPGDTPSTAHELLPPLGFRPVPAPAFGGGTSNEVHPMPPGGSQQGEPTTPSSVEHQRPSLPAGGPMGPPLLRRSLPYVPSAGMALGLVPGHHTGSTSAATLSPTHLHQGGLPPVSPCGPSAVTSSPAPSDELVRISVSNALQSALPALRTQYMNDTCALLANHQENVNHSVRETMKGGFETLRKELTERLELSMPKQRKKGKAKGKSAVRQALRTRDKNAPASASDADIESNADAASEADVHFDISAASTQALQKALRKILAQRAGIDLNMRVHPRIYELEYVASVSQSPFHPAEYEPHPTDKPVPACDRPPGAESPYRKLRFNYPAGAEQEPNRTYIEEIAVFLKSKGSLYGLHPEVTVVAIVDLIVKRFNVQAMDHQRWLKDPHGYGRNLQNEAGRRKERLETKALVRRQLAGAATAERRSASSSPGKSASEASSTESDTDGKMPDFLAAYHVDCQSAEDTDPSPPPIGIPSAKVLRCRRPEWGSAQLHIVKRRGDKYRVRQFHVTDSENELEFADAQLPPAVQKWMVSKEFAAAHPEACSNVLDNQGPFLGEGPACAQAVIGGPKEWGSRMPARKRRKTNTGEVLEEQTHPLALTFRLPSECRSSIDPRVGKFAMASVGPSNSRRFVAAASASTNLLAGVRETSAFSASGSGGCSSQPAHIPYASPSQRASSGQAQLLPSMASTGQSSSLPMHLPRAPPGQPRYIPHASSSQPTSQPAYILHASSGQAQHPSPAQSPGQSPGQSMHMPMGVPHAQSPDQSMHMPMGVPHAPSPSQSMHMPMGVPHAPSPSQSPSQPMRVPHAPSPSQSPSQPMRVPHAPSPSQSPSQPMRVPHAPPEQALAHSHSQPMHLSHTSPGQSMLATHHALPSQTHSQSPGQPATFPLGVSGRAIAASGHNPTFPQPSSNQHTVLSHGPNAPSVAFAPMASTPSSSQEWGSFESSQLASYSQELPGLDSPWTSSSQGGTFATGPSLGSSQLSSFSAESQGPSQNESQDELSAWADLFSQSGGTGSGQTYPIPTPQARLEEDADLEDEDSLERMSAAEYIRRKRAAVQRGL